MITLAEAKQILVADECWVALALLHRSHPERSSFSPREIVERLRLERAYPELRPGVQPHIYLHNVANLPPNSAKYRMFYRLPDGALRLFRPGDDSHSARSGKTKPDRSDLPSQYHELLDWYERDYSSAAGRLDPSTDPVLAMRGTGKEIWADEGADAFVARLREGWDEGEKPPTGRRRRRSRN